MSDDVVLHERRAGYAILTLNRPDRLNAFNGRSMLRCARRCSAARQTPSAAPFC